jgi:hypothetical protein
MKPAGGVRRERAGEVRHNMGATECESCSRPPAGGPNPFQNDALGVARRMLIMD